MIKEEFKQKYLKDCNCLIKARVNHICNELLELLREVDVVACIDGEFYCGPENELVYSTPCFSKLESYEEVFIKLRDFVRGIINCPESFLYGEWLVYDVSVQSKPNILILGFERGCKIPMSWIKRNKNSDVQNDVDSVYDMAIDIDGEKYGITLICFVNQDKIILDVKSEELDNNDYWNTWDVSYICFERLIMD